MHYIIQHRSSFTPDLYRMQQAWDTPDAGGFVIGDVPSWRVDNMPDGGVKDSRPGREGVRFAMEELRNPESGDSNATRPDLKSAREPASHSIGLFRTHS